MCEVYEVTTCPVCGRRSIGKVGADQYYCWDCCIEFFHNGKETKIYNIEDDGSLTLFNDSLQETY